MTKLQPNPRITTQLRPLLPGRLITTLILALALTGCNLDQGGFNQSAKGPVTLYWFEPESRVNGEKLADGDIVAYAIRYRHETSQRYTTLVVDNEVGRRSYYFPAIADPENTIFQMAAIDKDGLYSNFVTAAR